MVHPLIIIGAGPAGLSAALYAARSGIKTVVLEKGVAGGQLLLTEWVENYPGSGFVKGSLLARQFLNQARDAGAEIEEGAEVTWVEIENRIKILKTPAGELRAEALIIASGSTPRTLNVPGEKKLVGKGVSYCALCDAPFFKGKRVAVVGGGDSAAGEAIFLSQYAEEVTILHRRDALNAEWALRKRLLENPRIKTLYSVGVKGIGGENKVESVSIQNNKTGEMGDLSIDGLFVFIGSAPQTNFTGGLNILNSDRFVLTDELSRTLAPGVFAAGEARAGSLKQIVTSAGEGAAAALMAARYLENNRTRQREQ